LDIYQSIEHEKVLRPSFTEHGAPLETWNNWLTALKFAYALPIEDRKERAFIKKIGGLERYVQPVEPFRTFIFLVGRRGGKSKIAAANGIYLATLSNMDQYLSGGEFGYVLIIAVDKLQSQIIKRYCADMLRKSPILKKMIRTERTNEIELTNNVIISIRSASFRSVRGYTLLAAILDEAAFYRSDESANPASELIKALRPGLLTIPMSKLILISSVHNRAGIAYEADSKYFGTIKRGSPLVLKATSLEMNPTLDKAMIDQELKDDPSGASAEYLSIFRSDVESFLPAECVENCVVPGRFELPMIAECSYKAFIDPSGGSGTDSFTLAITHREKSGNVVLDCVRERRPRFSPKDVVKEFSSTLISYGLRSAHSDRYAGEWVKESFRDHGIEIKNSELSKSEIYLEFLPMVLNGSVELLDNRRLVGQLANLERRTRTGGKDLVDHPVGMHDDVANGAAGACVLNATKHAKAYFKLSDFDMY
jgi:hypothetical protein